MNLVYIPLIEEPMTEARFGDSYREYKKHVGMFIPRLTPWRRADADASAMTASPSRRRGRHGPLEGADGS